MTLKIRENAIELSGQLGTKLKSLILGKYYSFWWQITSGNKAVDYKYNTTLIELNAATGIVYIKDTNEFVPGSAGHALELKFNNKFVENPNLNVILIEENAKCLYHLRKNIEKKYPCAEIKDANFKKGDYKKKTLILNDKLEDVIEKLNRFNIKGTSLYFFDPLLNVDFCYISEIYEQRHGLFLKTGIEFIIFIFTSDWVYGRKDELVPLPKTSDESKWSEEEIYSVDLLDTTLNGLYWHDKVLNELNQKKRLEFIIKYYQKQLHSLFRFVVPLPFSPKNEQIYHLMFCSNSQTGASLISRFYEKHTSNHQNFDNDRLYKIFKRKYYRKFHNFHGSKRPSEWKVLWQLYRYYRNGLFDIECEELLKQVNQDYDELDSIFKWLLEEEFIKKINYKQETTRYRTNYHYLHEVLQFPYPKKYKPLTNNDFSEKKEKRKKGLEHFF